MGSAGEQSVKGERRERGVVGTLSERLRDYPCASSSHQQAFTLSTVLEDHAKQAHILSSLGNVAHDQGRFAEALGYHDRAVSLCRDAGDRRQLAP